MASDYPEELRYTNQHEWARIDNGGKTVVVGITKHAVEQLGDVTQIDLPKEGARVTKDEAFGTVESVKAVSDLFAPVTGVVTKVNDSLADSPEMVNDDSYDEGWMIEVEMSDPAEALALLTAAQYREFLRQSE